MGWFKEISKCRAMQEVLPSVNSTGSLWVVVVVVVVVVAAAAAAAAAVVVVVVVVATK